MGNIYVSMGDALDAMAAEVRAINIEKGWRRPDGSTERSFAEDIALLHSEVSEALEAYRDHGLDDATSVPGPCVPIGSMCATHDRDLSWCDFPPKPEGVGSELADVLIRLLDTADAFGIDLGREYRRKIEFNRTRPARHGGKRL